MRVKVGNIWHGPDKEGICIELTAQDKVNINGMDPHEALYAAFPNDIKKERAYEWMGRKPDKDAEHLTALEHLVLLRAGNTKEFNSLPKPIQSKMLGVYEKIKDLEKPCQLETSLIIN